MAFNDIEASNYYMRISTSLNSGWSKANKPNIDNEVHAGDSENLLFLTDGTMRFYISNGNLRKHVIWFVDSSNFADSWTVPKKLHFSGFSPPGINWAQIARFTDPTAIAMTTGII